MSVAWALDPKITMSLILAHLEPLNHIFRIVLISKHCFPHPFRCFHPKESRRLVDADLPRPFISFQQQLISLARPFLTEKSDLTSNE